jgi:hypothetical protein
MSQLAAALIVLLAPSMASAYTGPGAGITAIGALLGLVSAVLLAIVGVVWFPIKRLMRARAARANAAREVATTDSARD